MKIVFYSVVLNQHQAPVADELWELTNHQYTFVELVNLDEGKGGTEDYSTRPYLLRAWESEDAHVKAMELARTADCCVFSGIDALPYQRERMKYELLSFDMGERWFKHGYRSLASFRLWRWLIAYYGGGWRNKPLYKLCCSAFCASDHNILNTFKKKCFKWGYFTQVGCFNNYSLPNNIKKQDGLSIESNKINLTIRMMWCARFIDWKHPELPITLAILLKRNLRDFHLDMYGDGEMRSEMEELVKSNGLDDVVSFHGNVSNKQIHSSMKEHDIFLFTSDRQEGWGAVANEAMSEGCVLVGSDEIGAVPYLVKHKETGMIFRSCDLDSLYEQVKYLLDNPEARKQISKAGRESMVKLWSPQNAARSLLQLIEDIQAGRETSIVEGPCSKA